MSTGKGTDAPWYWITTGKKIKNLERMPISHKIKPEDRKKIVRRTGDEEALGPERLKRFRKKKLSTAQSFTSGSKEHEAFLDLELHYEEPTEQEEEAVNQSSKEKKKPRDEITEVTQTVYVQACRKFGVVPCRDIIRLLPGKDLLLRNKLLEPNEIQPIAYALTTNSSITNIDFSGNHIGKSGLIDLSRMFTENYNISLLTLRNCRLGLEEAMILRLILEKNTSITCLDLSENEFDDSAAEHIGAVIQENQYIRKLDLSNNRFRERGGKFLATALSINFDLETLNLSWNQIRMSGATAMGDALKKNSALKDINLSWNGFADIGIKPLSKALEVNTALLRLDISNNRITDAGCKILGRSLKKNNTLSYLAINQNPVSDVGVMFILNGIRDNEESAIGVLDIKDTPIFPEAFDVIDWIKARNADFSIIYGGLLRSKSCIPKLEKRSYTVL